MIRREFDALVAEGVKSMILPTVLLLSGSCQGKAITEGVRVEGVGRREGNTCSRCYVCSVANVARVVDLAENI